MCSMQSGLHAVEIEERRLSILSMLEKTGSISVSKICETFGMSEVTARSDLAALERMGKLRRVRGGALSISHTLMITPPSQRVSVNTDAKQRIATLACDLVEDGDSLFVDSGTTTLEFVKALSDKRDITIATSDLPIANYVEESLPHATTVFAGGTIRRGHHYCCGPLTIKTLSNLYADKAFLGANSFSPGHGLMTEYLAAAEVKQAMLEQSREHILLMDSSKVGLNNFIRFAELGDMSCIVMDRDPDGIVAKAIESAVNPPRMMLAE